MAQEEGSPNDNLSKEQVVKLAKVMYYKGVQGIHVMTFRSEFERARYVKCCRDTYLESLDLVNSAESAVNEFKDDASIAAAVEEYAKYIKKAIWAAHKITDIYSQRAVHIAQLKKHAATVLKVLSEHKLSPLNQARLAEFIEDISLLSKALLKYEAQAKTSAARKFYRGLRTYGYTFSKLIRRYQTVLGFKGPFEKLAIQQKLQVFDKVIEVTGGRKLLKFGANTLEALNKYSGNAVLGLIAMGTAIDLYAAHPDKRYEMAMKSVVTVGSSYLLGMLESYIYAQVAFALISTGNPALVVAGIAIGVATYFASDAIEAFIANSVVPLVLDFMNNYRNEVRYGLEILSFNPNVSLLELAGLPYDKIPRLLKYRPGAFQLYEILFNDQLNVGPSFFISPLLSLTPAGAMIDVISGKSKDPVMDLVLSLPILGLFRDIYEAFSKPKPGSNLSEMDANVTSTYGLRVHGPEVPDGTVLSLQIAHLRVN